MTDSNNNHPWYERHPIKSALAAISILGGIWGANYFIFNEKANNLNNQILSAKTTAETYKAQKELAEQKLRDNEEKLKSNSNTDSYSEDIKNLKKRNNELETEVSSLKEKLDLQKQAKDSEAQKNITLTQRNNELIDKTNKTQAALHASENRAYELAANSPIRVETHQKDNSANKSSYPFLKTAKVGEAVTDPVTKATIAINYSSVIEHTGSGILTLPNQPQQNRTTFASGQVIPFEFKFEQYALRIVKIDTFDYTVQIDVE